MSADRCEHLNYRGDCVHCERAKVARLQERLVNATDAARWLLYEWDQLRDDTKPILERWPWLAKEGTDART